MKDEQCEHDIKEPQRDEVERRPVALPVQNLARTEQEKMEPTHQ